MPSALSPDPEEFSACDLQIPADDGFVLAASIFGPATASDGVVLIAPATAVRRRLYSRFARELASVGFTAVTWDWRGTGDSRPESLRGFQASMLDWARLDLAGVIDWAEKRFVDSRLFGIGHSFGGQAFGLAPNGNRVERLVTVAAQSGWLGHWSFPHRLLYAGLWYFVVPASTRLLGYMPGWIFGAGEDLPRGVALQWARWCRSPDYLGDYSGHAQFTAPILAVGATDDAFASRRAMQALHREYASSEITWRIVESREYGVQEIGHFGYFRAPELKSLRDEIAAWLRNGSGSDQAP